MLGKNDSSICENESFSKNVFSLISELHYADSHFQPRKMLRKITDLDFSCFEYAERKFSSENFYSCIMAAPAESCQVITSHYFLYNFSIFISYFDQYNYN